MPEPARAVVVEHQVSAQDKRATVISRGPARDTLRCLVPPVEWESWLWRWRRKEVPCGMATWHDARLPLSSVSTTMHRPLPLTELPTYTLPSHQVPYMAALAMAFGCNHLISLACELDREATKENLAMLDSEDERTRSKCPLLAPAGDRARDAAYYAASYVTKPIKPSQSVNVLKALSSMQGFFLEGTPLLHESDLEVAGRAGFGNLLACVNRLTSSVTMGLAMVSYLLMGHQTYWASYDVKPMATHAYTGRALRDASVSDDAVQGGQVGVTLVPHGDGYRAVTTLTDYDGRGDELGALPPYVYHAFYARRQRPKPKPRGGRSSTQRARKRRRTGAGVGAALYVDADAASSGNGSGSDDEDGEARGSGTPAEGRVGGRLQCGLTWIGLRARDELALGLGWPPGPRGLEGVGTGERRRFPLSTWPYRTLTIGVHKRQCIRVGTARRPCATAPLPPVYGAPV